MKALIFIIFLIVTPSMSLSQYKVDKAKKDKITRTKFDFATIKDDLYVGGDFNLMIGGTALVYVSPFIGYEFIPSLSAGVSVLGRYLTNGSSSLSSIGTGVFLRYKPELPIILETAFNGYSTSFSNGQESLGGKAWMLGIGYAYGMGDRSYSQFMIQYDLLKNQNVPESIMMSFPGGGRLYYKFGIVFYLSDY